MSETQSFAKFEDKLPGPNHIWPQNFHQQNIFSYRNMLVIINNSNKCIQKVHERTQRRLNGIKPRILFDRVTRSNIMVDNTPLINMIHLEADLLVRHIQSEAARAEQELTHLECMWEIMETPPDQRSQNTKNFPYVSNCAAVLREWLAPRIRNLEQWYESISSQRPHRPPRYRQSHHNQRVNNRQNQQQHRPQPQRRTQTQHTTRQRQHQHQQTNYTEQRQQHQHQQHHYQSQQNQQSQHHHQYQHNPYNIDTSPRIRTNHNDEINHRHPDDLSPAEIINIIRENASQHTIFSEPAVMSEVQSDGDAQSDITIPPPYADNDHSTETMEEFIKNQQTTIQTTHQNKPKKTKLCDVQNQTVGLSSNLTQNKEPWWKAAQKQASITFKNLSSSSQKPSAGKPMRRSTSPTQLKVNIKTTNLLNESVNSQ
jgi:hypothetical protein